MGIAPSSMPGGITPVCSDCGVALCWDISVEEYCQGKEFWDEWKCSGCNPNYKGALKRFREERK